MNRLHEFIKDTQENPKHYGKQTHLAVNRFLQDAVKSEEDDSPYIFDDERAQRVINFIECLNQTKGKWARMKLILAPWQVFIVANIFGWLDRKTGLRRYNVAYISVGRKNGKSTLLSGISLYMLFADGEPSAEIYLGANSREQAGILFGQVKDTIQTTPGLSKRLSCQTYSIFHKKSLSFLRKVSSESKTLDGLNIHSAVLDEVHEFQNDKLWNVFRGGMGGREQPLLVGITTAGLSLDGFGFQQEEYTKGVLDGSTDDPTYFGIIFSIDEGDDVSDESTWIKANPNLGVSVSLKDMQAQYRESKLSPQKLSDFISKRLNKYVSQQKGWLNLDIIQKAAKQYTLDELKGLPCVGALDLSQRHDFTVYSLTFPTLNFHTIWRYFLPEEDFLARCEFENANYAIWERDKWLTLTPGKVIDYDFVTESVKKDMETYDIKEFAFDPWKSRDVINHLTEHGLNCVEFRQSMQYMSPAISVLTHGFMSETISIDINPISLWCFANVEVRPDANGNQKFMKGPNPKKRIDGAIAHAMSFYRAYLLTNQKEDSKPQSVLKSITWI